MHVLLKYKYLRCLKYVVPNEDYELYGENEEGNIGPNVSHTKIQVHDLVPLKFGEKNSPKASWYMPNENSTRHKVIGDATLLIHLSAELVE